MSKFAAIFAAAVLFITIGACVSGQNTAADAGDNAAVVQTL